MPRWTSELTITYEQRTRGATGPHTVRIPNVTSWSLEIEHDRWMSIGGVDVLVYNQYHAVYVQCGSEFYHWVDVIGVKVRP